MKARIHTQNLKAKFHVLNLQVQVYAYTYKAHRNMHQAFLVHYIHTMRVYTKTKTRKVSSLMKIEL